jgi:hypothetical protein
MLARTPRGYSSVASIKRTTQTRSCVSLPDDEEEKRNLINAALWTLFPPPGRVSTTGKSFHHRDELPPPGRVATTLDEFTPQGRDSTSSDEIPPPLTSFHHPGRVSTAGTRFHHPDELCY